MRQYVEWVVRHAYLVIGLIVLITAALIFQIRNLKVIIDPGTNLPQDHPYVVTTNLVEERFGSKNVVVIGITPKEGDAFQVPVLERVQRITDALADTPGVLKDRTLSLSGRRAKNIIGTPEGMEVRPLMETLPQTPEEIQNLRRAVQSNPVYYNAIVSKDERTVAIIAEYRDPKEEGYRGIMESIQKILDKERDPSIEIAVGGWPVYGALIEHYSQRVTFLFPIAVLITGLIHFEAFRTIQGLILPLLTALLAVTWGVGLMGLAGVPMDAFSSATPILILATAAGHAVQILKRYYEEYHRIRGYSTSMSPEEINRAAVVASVTQIGPVMLTAGSVAAIGFFSLLVFKMTVIRTFGVFTGLGILGALILEMAFTPALRSLLPPPKEREETREQSRRVWDRITETLHGWMVGTARRWIFAVVIVLILIWIAGVVRVKVEADDKRYFFENLPFQQEDRMLNARLGGTNTLYLLVEGKGEDAIKDPKVLRAIETTQRFLEQQPQVGKTISIADFIKRMNLAMHGDDPAYDQIPESEELVAQYLLLYSMSGESGDFDTYVDYGYQSANIWAFLKTSSSSYLQELVMKLNDFLPAQFGDSISVRLGGGLAVAEAMHEEIVRGKIQNILQIGGIIFLISAMVFRSLWAGLLVLVPLSLAVLGNFGLMGLLGIEVNIATATIAAMAVGIGADYAIYLIYRLREELSRGPDEAAALRTTLTTAGKAILFVSTAIAGGYAVLLLSWGFNIHVWFGFLIATAMIISALAALTVLPSLILTFRPRFIFGNAHKVLKAPVAAITFLIGAGLICGTALAAELSAEEISERSSRVDKVQDSISEATFTLINKNGQQRVRKTFGTTKLQPNGVDRMRMVRFLSPPDIKDTVTLMIEHSDRDDDLWIYLPGLKKVRRLVASNKKDSFVGTDFSYGDVIGYKVEEWEHHLLREEVVDGLPCYVIEALPKTDTLKANNGYSKRLGWIRKDNFVMVKAEFWDTTGEFLKTYTASDVRQVDPVRNRWQAMRLEMPNHQTGHRTILEFENFKANQGVKDDYFTTRYIEKQP